jgi:surfeit locus 1 family protein
VFRFLATPRWIALTLITIVVAATCVGLGMWQLDRLEGRRYFNERFRVGMAEAPEPIERLLAHPGNGPITYRRATATGRYDTDHEVLLYGRALDGQPGNHVLTPLVIEDGRAVIIDRGWVPFDVDTTPVLAATPPDGIVVATGFLSPTEPGGTNDAAQDADGRGATTFTRVDLGSIGALLPYELLPWYIALQDQSPAQSGELPRTVPPPTLDDGPHLSYAFQWFSFATIAIVGYGVLVRREVHR